MSTIILGLLAILFVMLAGFLAAIFELHRNGRRWERYHKHGKPHWRVK